MLSRYKLFASKYATRDESGEFVPAYASFMCSKFCGHQFCVRFSMEIRLSEIYLGVASDRSLDKLEIHVLLCPISITNSAKERTDFGLR